MGKGGSRFHVEHSMLRIEMLFPSENDFRGIARMGTRLPCRVVISDTVATLCPGYFSRGVPWLVLSERFHSLR